MGGLIRGLVLWLVLAGGAAGQEMSALARVDAAGSAITDAQGGIVLRLALSQPVPYRVRHLDRPRRLVVDFREVDWRGIDIAALDRSARVSAVQAGRLRPGWSRLVLELAGPQILRQAEMTDDPLTGRAMLRLRLVPVSRSEYAAQSVDAQSALWGLPAPRKLPPPRRRQDGSRPLRVVLDPGHGGIDPGAQVDGTVEARLMLTFAREVQAVLRRAGMQAVLTRSDDSFVPLEARITRARAARADVMLSLHADALAEGRATGAAVYTLSENASDRAAQLLAERHDRADLLAGVDLKGQDDAIAGVLMDLARTDTAPRSDALASALVAGLRRADLPLHKHAHQTAGFSVLKAPDFPSALIELGFLSSPRDLARLTDPEWRARAAAAIADALTRWAEADAANAALLRH